MRKITFLGALALLFYTGCSFPDSWYVSGASSSITSKTEMKPFPDLKNPIVLDFSYSPRSSLFGVKGWAEKTNLEGGIFFVIDTETNSVHDWAFYPYDSGVSVAEPVLLGKNQNCYCSSGWNRGIVGILGKDSGKIKCVSYEKSGSLLTGSTASDLGMLYDVVSSDDGPVIELDFFNLVTESVEGENTLRFKASLNHPDMIPCANGDYIFSFQDDENSYIYRIDVQGRNAELLQTYKIEGEHAIVACELVDDDFYVVASHNEHYADTTQSDYYKYTTRTLLELYDTKTNSLKKSMYMHYEEGEPSALYELYKYDGKFYALVIDASPWENYKIAIYSVDFEEESYKCLGNVEVFLQAHYQYGSRIYFMDYADVDSGVIKYFYFDCETGLVSTTYSISYIDTITGE